MAVPAITLENIWRIYYWVAMFATILFILKLIMFTVVGGDTEVVSDFNTEVDTDCSFTFLSTQSILAFLMGFGWMGYAALRQFGMEQLISFGLAFLVGFLFMGITSYLMFMVRKLEENVKKDKTKAIEHTGKAYTSFAPHAAGQVEVEISGQLSVVNAMNNSDEQINAFDLVKVVKVVDDLLYIEKRK